MEALSIGTAMERPAKAKRGGANKCQAKAKHRSARASLSNAEGKLRAAEAVH